jgi:phage repressor protein C with HTH and peptisase S24 domain
VPPLGLGRAWIRSQLKASPTDLVVVAARGDAMEPTVGDGDLLLADITRRGDGEDGIYALRRDGRVAVRRLQFSVDGGLVIRCDNRSYGDEHLEREDVARLDLIGRVVWAGRGL